MREATDNRQETDSKWRKAITFDALGWHMAERCQQAGLLPGDTLDIAFSIENNDHPEYGGSNSHCGTLAGSRTPVSQSGSRTKEIAAGL